MPKSVKELENKHFNFSIGLETIGVLIHHFGQDWLWETYKELQKKTKEAYIDYKMNIKNIEVVFEEVNKIE